MTCSEIQNRLAKLANEERAQVLRGFFKTGPGQYAEGDIFLGITVPVLRSVAKECGKTTIKDSVRLLRSRVHEERLMALFLLIASFGKGDGRVKARIYHLYLENLQYVNNWDLVDLSAPNIAGAYLSDRSRRPLYNLARSTDLWERRASIVATLYFIRQDDLGETFTIARMLLNDEHDLIHKSVGWMLREAGKRDQLAEESFLKTHYRTMPRTMLRYAIERFPEKKRKSYLAGTV